MHMCLNIIMYTCEYTYTYKNEFSQRADDFVTK